MAEPFCQTKERRKVIHNYLYVTVSSQLNPFGTMRLHNTTKKETATTAGNISGTRSIQITECSLLFSDSKKVVSHIPSFLPFE